jgi:hypothetical protein
MPVKMHEMLSGDPAALREFYENLDRTGRFNSLMDLQIFFSTDEKPCVRGEVQAFWKSMDEQERMYYRFADLGV